MRMTPEDREKAIDMLKAGVCPICGKNYKIPLSHIAKKHGIPSNEFKDAIHVGRHHSFASPDFSNKIRLAVQEEFRRNPKRLQSFKEASEESVKKAWDVRRRPVVRIDKNKNHTVYQSLIEAAKANNVSLSAVFAWVSGRSNPRTGDTWKYGDKGDK